MHLTGSDQDLARAVVLSSARPKSTSVGLVQRGLGDGELPIRLGQFLVSRAISACSAADLPCGAGRRYQLSTDMGI